MFRICDIVVLFICFVLTLGCVCLTANYSLRPRIEAIKTRNYDCVFVNDPYTCMRTRKVQK